MEVHTEQHFYQRSKLNYTLYLLVLIVSYPNKDFYKFFKKIVCFDSLHPSQQFFSHVGSGLPRLNQYLTVDKVF